MRWPNELLGQVHYDEKFIVPQEVTPLAVKAMGGPGFDKGNFGDLKCGLRQHHHSWMQIRGHQDKSISQSVKSLIL